MLEIAIDNCHKCDIETINDPNNSQYFSINRRDLEILNWQRYRKELTPNVTFQLNKIFVRTNLFEQII